MIGWKNTIPVVGEVAMAHHFKLLIDKNVVNNVSIIPNKIKPDEGKLRPMMPLFGNRARIDQIDSIIFSDHFTVSF